MANIKGFTFFASYYDAIDFLDEGNKAKMVLAICEYAFNGVVPNFDNPILSGYWQLMLPTLSKSVKRSVAGQEALGKSKSKADERQNESESEANQMQEENKPKANQKQIKSKSKANQKQDESKPKTITSLDKDKDKDNEYSSSPSTSMVNVPFEEWWKLYDKKVERSKCEPKWNKLKDEEREAIMVHTKEYVLSTPDKQYRKNPLTYLNGKCWNDEILPPHKTEEPPQEISLQERHTKFVQWLANTVNDENAMLIYHVSLDNFIEMLNYFCGDANKMAKEVLKVIRHEITYEEGLIGAFRKYKDGTL